MPLTVQEIKSTPAPRTGRTVLSDGRGLELRITPNGVRTFSFVGVLHGKKRRWTLGRFPDLTLKSAREMRDTYASSLARGIDPVRGQAGRDGARLAEAFEEFLKRYAYPRNRSAPEAERMLRHDLLPRFGHYPVSRIRRADIQSMLSEIADRGAPVQAGRVLANTRKLFNWCIEQEYCEANPCDRIGQPVSAAKIRRERVLTADELGRIWGASMSQTPHAGAFVRLLMLTGQRRGEVAQLRLAQTDGDIWTVPREAAKNSRPNTVPLSLQSRAVICWMQQFWPPEDRDDLYLFSGKTGHRPFSGFSKVKQSLDRSSKVRNWRWHDLRRTMATWLSENGVPPHVVSALLNHKDQSVTAIYNRYEYLDEKRDALELWAAHVEEQGRPHLPDMPGPSIQGIEGYQDILDRLRDMLERLRRMQKSEAP
ncbi:MAG: tyrosine-type recombinase/integrase [Minwuia sp.]|uniref:tyrosine-type recombinase/integrase n=1 Tax=Minwuia sp. TaxID=2493630 RepID=UPI003A86D1DB